MKKIILFFLVVVLLIGFSSCSKKPSGRVEKPAETSTETGEAEAEPEEWPPGIGDVEVVLEEDQMKRNYYIIFDGSGSMRGEKIQIAKKAFKEFVDLVPPDANLGLIVFDSKNASQRVPLGSNRKAILEEIDKVRAGGGTPLGPAAEFGYRMLTDQALKQLGYGEYNLVIVTDGEASDAGELKESVDMILKKSPIIIHTIGFRIEGGHTLNQPGKISYRSAESYEDLRRGLEEVLAEAEDFVVDEFKSE